MKYERKEHKIIFCFIMEMKNKVNETNNIFETKDKRRLDNGQDHSYCTASA